MASITRLLVAVRTLLVLTVLFGIAYPLLVWGIGQVAMHGRANGSLIESGQTVIGSRLVGQLSTGPTWFHSRPSAAGDGYDMGASGGSNLGPNSKELTELIAKRRAAVAAEESVAPSAVPPDAVTASGSGLDPDISADYAYLQVNRVAARNGLSRDLVTSLVTDHVTGGVLSPRRVNVLELNLALQQAVAAK